MNQFEKNLRTDTLLNVGLLTIGIVWIALAAVKGPTPLDVQEQEVGYAAARVVPAQPSLHATAQPSTPILHAAARAS